MYNMKREMGFFFLLESLELGAKFGHIYSVLLLVSVYSVNSNEGVDAED